MPGRAVLDSNILAALFFKEEASLRAMDAAAGADLITLDLAITEVGNVAWKQVVLFGEDKDIALQSFEKCQRFITQACELLRAEDLAEEAFNISIEIKTTFYDSLFLAGAARMHVPLLTLDKSLYERAKSTSIVNLI